VVQAADQRTGCNVSNPLNSDARNDVFAFSCIRRIGMRDPAQVLLAEYYEVFRAFATGRPNRPLGKAVLPLRPGQNRRVVDPHRPRPAPDNGPTELISLSETQR
jgi:hypothetical protein